MGYVAVKGGTKAIEESLRRLKYERLKEKQVLDVERIAAGMRGLIDIVMSESSLYDETLAALAIKQAEGDPAEAVFLLRAYRSTLPRKHYSLPVETEEMQIKRRISASFKDIPGGQILGATRDYSHRLLDFSLMEETDHEAISWLADYENHLQTTMEHDTASVGRLPKISDYLRKEGLFPERPIDHREPDDVTRKSLSFPTSRSQRLQVLTRGETGAVTALGYAVIRGYGALHPTVGELRIGHLPVTIENPLNESAGPDDAYYIGDVCATEVEMLMPITVEKAQGKKEIEFEIGYGLCFGENESKAIAMGILDHSLEIGDKRFATGDEEFVLYHIDSVEANGFISHLKLPHYVTFQSKLDVIRKTKQKDTTEERSEHHANPV